MVYHLQTDVSPPAEHRSTISSEWFGVIQIGYKGFHGFDRQFPELGGQAIRWPGGTLSETDHDVYDLRKPEVFDGRHLFKFNPDRERPSLADMLEYCVRHDLPFSMVIPTERYAKAYTLGEQDVRDFVSRLVDGFYGSLPKDFTLEIGNEYYDLPRFADDPGNYGLVADRFVLAIADVLDNPALNPDGIDLRIAVQAGKYHDDNEAILAEISPEALREIDEIVIHTLPISFENFRDPAHRGGPDVELNRTERIMAYSERWQEAIGKAGGLQEVDVYISAWSIGGNTSDPTKIDLAFRDYGLRAASTMLDMFAGFSTAGVDAAAAWGIHTDHLNHFARLDAQNAIDISPAGAMFGLMSEALVGTAFVGAYGMTDREDPFMTYHFTGSDKSVIYIAANDIDDSGAKVVLHLPENHAYEISAITSLSATLEAYSRGWDRLFEAPIVTDLPLPGDTTPDEGTLELAFRRDYEIMQVVLDLLPGAAPPDAQAVPVPVDPAILPAPDTTEFLLGDHGEQMAFGLDDGADRIPPAPGTDQTLIVEVEPRGMPQASADGPGTITESLISGQIHGPALPRQGLQAPVPGMPEHEGREGTEENDMIQGGPGSDDLHLGAGSSTLDGGAGIDTLFLPRDLRTKIDLASTQAQETAMGTVLLRSIENIVGGRFGDTLSGSNGGNILSGKGGYDVIDGRGGMDTLIGGKGRDHIHGGDDRARDTFVFETIYDSKPGTKRDVIHDFLSRIDRIDVSAIDANLFESDNQAFGFTGTRPAPNSIWTHDIGRNMLVRGDVNGDARHDFEIELTGVDTLLSIDFLL